MIESTTFSQYCELAKAGGIVPVVHELAADTLTPVTAYAAIARPPFGFILESLVGGERWARYTFLGTDPREAWRYRHGMKERWTPDAEWESMGACPDPLTHIGSILRGMPAIKLEGLPRFVGGAVGYLGYDVVRSIAALPGGPEDDLQLPDAVFMIADNLVIIDNAFGRAIVVANTQVSPNPSATDLRRAYQDAEDRIAVQLERLRTPPVLKPISLDDVAPLNTESAYPRESFMQDVSRIKEHIAAGDVYQAVLSRRQDVQFQAEHLDVYRALRVLNPAPYLYFLTLDDISIAGSSPEVLVRVEEKEITVRPIAGTRSRGATPDEDARLGQELLRDEKELAEHTMLVDLGRNDVGKVATFGSVHLTVDKVIEGYSHVQHIVSEVRGSLRPEYDAIDALRSCFPAGTVSGAPKLRAMQILDGMEPTRRGPYAGAICHIGWGGVNLDTAITIRTAVLRKQTAYVQAGAGIVADSDPAREFDETEKKAGAVLRALALASRR